MPTRFRTFPASAAPPSTASTLKSSPPLLSSPLLSSPLLSSPCRSPNPLSSPSPLNLRGARTRLQPQFERSNPLPLNLRAAPQHCRPSQDARIISVFPLTSQGLEVFCCCWGFFCVK